MIPFVTLEEAKNHLRVSGTDSDDDIGLKILQASAITCHRLKITDPAVPSAEDGIIASTWGSPLEIPTQVKAITLLVLGAIHEGRESEVSNIISDGMKRLIEPYRDPTMA